MTTTTHSQTPIQCMRIRVAASALGWNAAELHRAIGDDLSINYPSVRDIFNGVRKEEVPPSWLKVIADATYQSFEWLSGFDGGQFREPTQDEIAEANRAKGLWRDWPTLAISAA